jgi:hypothetical protein
VKLLYCCAIGNPEIQQQTEEIAGGKLSPIEYLGRESVLR